VGRGAVAIGGLGIPAVLLVVLLQVCGGDAAQLAAVLEQLQAQVPAVQATRDPAAPDPQADLLSFVSYTLDDVQGTWAEVFDASGLDYTPSTMVVYDRGTSTGCGYGTAAIGPFYCPADQGTYIDLAFFDDLDRRFDAPGDFAQAYVIAHEIGHHVQNLLGISSQVRQEQQARPDDANTLSVRQELQADCFAGVWAAAAYDDGILERGDLEEAITAAEAIGDDAIQQQSGRPVNPETWTHGSSEQRQTWFRRGFDTGDPNQCDTFTG
jgi:predicted metalloprotease